jgi:SET and MYND domain-containing protein
MYDRIGLYLHPYAALINHSCDYNATVGFDGEELYVKAIRPIKKDEQIFISYIDTTTPREVRRKELTERYFFDCQCTKCVKGTDTPEDKFIQTPKDIAILETAEKQALELMQEASRSDGKPEEEIKKLESAMRILKQTSNWPLSRQPYASIRDQLIISLLSVNNFSKAFLHAAIRYLRIDPVLFSPAHPIRQLHAWILAKLAIYLSQEGFESNSEEALLIQESELNFHYVLWYILADLASRQLESCTVPSFKRLVAANFAQVHNEFKANGMDPSTSKAIVSAEWKKLERLVQVALDRE